MKRIVPLFLSMLSLSLYAQDPVPVMKDTSYWKHAVKVGFNLTQASFSDNWKGGGVNSISYLAFLNATADYAKDKVTFNNLLDLQYGSINNKNSGYFKNADRIFFDSKVGYQFVKNWNLFASVNFLSQFYTGYTTKKVNDRDTNIYVSDFMAPGYLTEAIGVEYKPVPWFYVRFGTGAAKQTFLSAKNIDLVETKNYGVDPGKSFRNEFAFMLQSGIDKDLNRSVNFKAVYIAFANYSLPQTAKDNGITWFDYIDHRVNATLTAKVTKYLSTSLTGQLIYDYDQDINVQYSQALALGVLVTF